MCKKYLFYFFMLTGCSLLISCGNGQKPVAVSTVAKRPVIMQPFRYHKLIEVSPGQYYDILSWGRGPSATGAFMILHSDSATARYTTTTGDLDGAIVDVYNSDMDLDGNPEILIQAKSNDTTKYTTIYAFEFSNNKVQKIDFPKLTQSQKQGYRGNDNFYIKEGLLIREFPIYSGNDAKPTGQKRQLQYGLKNNSFTVKLLSHDTTNAVKTSQPVKTPLATKPAATKKHTVKHKKRRHRRHHHNAEEQTEL